MPLKKLANANAFVVRDLDNDAPAIGSIRSAAKVLQDPAKDLARVQTYQCAALNMKYQGASVGVSAAPEARDEAMAAVAEELLPEVRTGSLMFDPGMGISLAHLGSLAAADVRNDARTRDIEGTLSTVHLGALGAVVCAPKGRPLDGAARFAPRQLGKVSQWPARSPSPWSHTAPAILPSAADKPPNTEPPASTAATDWTSQNHGSPSPA